MDIITITTIRRNNLHQNRHHPHQGPYCRQLNPVEYDQDEYDHLHHDPSEKQPGIYHVSKKVL